MPFMGRDFLPLIVFSSIAFKRFLKTSAAFKTFKDDLQILSNVLLLFRVPCVRCQPTSLTNLLRTRSATCRSPRVWPESALADALERPIQVDRHKDSQTAKPAWQRAERTRIDLAIRFQKLWRCGGYLDICFVHIWLWVKKMPTPRDHRFWFKKMPTPRKTTGFASSFLFPNRFLGYPVFLTQLAISGFFARIGLREVRALHIEFAKKSSL